MRKLIYLAFIISASMLLFWQCNRSDNTEESMEESAETEMESETEEVSGPSLTHLWETPAELTTCESVFYEEATGSIYVANINGDPSAKDGNGFISTISSDGEILEQEWVGGLNAPKGMGISDGKLYVTDVDELVEIDIASASVSQTWPVEGAEFLNDIAIGNGMVYFSDSGTGSIHVLDDGEVSTFAEGQEGINGLRTDSDGTLYGLDGAGLKRYHSDGTAEIINDVVTGGDGLIILDEDEGTYLASRWQGEIWIVMGDEEVKLLDTKAEESNTADITYIASENIVLVPTFSQNKVAAYQLDY